MTLAIYLNNFRDQIDFCTIIINEAMKKPKFFCCPTFSIKSNLCKGKMYVLDGNGVKCECVITDEGNGILEIKNIATVPEYQGKGYARALIEFIINNYREQYSILQVGTGDSPLSIPFYEKCGFVRSHIISNFFTDNYDHPIYESGIQLVDMVYLQRPL